jgi:hypothetical protein
MHCASNLANSRRKVKERRPGFLSSNALKVPEKDRPSWLALSEMPLEAG